MQTCKKDGNGVKGPQAIWSVKHAVVSLAVFQKATEQV